MELESLENGRNALESTPSTGLSQSAPVSPRISGRSSVLGSQSGTPVPPSMNPRANQRVKGMPLASANADSKARKRSFHPDASLVLVGIRGCGKRSLGFIAATALGRRFVTEDHYFQSVTGLSRQDYFQIHGSQEFHKRDVEISQKMLDENKFKCVIECGLGSLTSSVQEHLRSYSLTNPVVYILRDMDEIKRLLKLGSRSARLLENGDPTHRRCSNFEFYNLEETTAEGPSENGSADRRSPVYSFKLKDAQESFSYFVRFISGASIFRPTEVSPFSLSEVRVDLRLYTHALEVLFSDFLDGTANLADLESGGDVIEIQVNRWSGTATRMLSKMVAEARRKVNVPVILSATRAQLDISTETYMTILEQGLRLGVEYLSVDLDLDNRQIAAVVACKGYTRIIGNYLEIQPTELGWQDEQWVNRYKRAEMLGCDIVRLRKLASSRNDNDALGLFTQKIRSRAAAGPSLIAYNVGPLGRTSQIFNQTFTSVTHDVLRRIGTNRGDQLEPQLSSQEAVQALFQSFVLDSLNFYILGAKVSKTLSPTMHNAAYRLLGLKHTYRAKDITAFDDLKTITQDPHFGGASIVQPWKVKILSRLASMSCHAEAIGAVNTILPLRTETNGSTPPMQMQASQRNRAGPVAAWFGDNTDWVGITVCLNRNLSPRNVVKSLKTTGLVIGAGGMARAAVYAMIQMGCRNVFVYNRTVANAEVLAKHFNTWAATGNVTTSADVSPASPVSELVRVMRSADEPWPAGFTMPTMIVSCVTQEHLDGKPAANFEMPLQWLQSPSGGVVIEQAYFQTSTPLINQIKRVRESTHVPWVVVDGLETLPEQGIAQFELMTGRKAPRGCMRDAVLRGLRDESDKPLGEQKIQHSPPIAL